MSRPEEPPRRPRARDGEDDREGGHAHPQKELSPDDFDIDNDREKGEDHLRKRSR
jgi:hypothetical protein